MTARKTGRAGPRTRGADARADILRAASAQFAHKGFRGTTLRSVAEAAAVDVALISYYFGNKDGLFAATLDLPVNPREQIAAVFEGGLDGIGERLARTFVTLLDDESTGPAMAGLLRAALTDGVAHDAVRDFISGGILETYVELLGTDDAAERATLVGSQVIGFAVMRRILRIEPLASMPVEAAVAHLGPTLQRYLEGPTG